MKEDKNFFFCGAIDPLYKWAAIVYTDYGDIILNNPPDCSRNLPPVYGPKHTQEFRYNPAAVLKHKLGIQMVRCIVRVNMHCAAI
jgi:signal peptidase I